MAIGLSSPAAAEGLGLEVVGVDDAQGIVTLSPLDQAGQGGCDNTTSNPQSCLFDYPSGQVVRLTATPAPDSVFEGWSGACTGTTPTCAVTMATAQSVTVRFRGPQPLDLTLEGVGTAQGSVSLDPGDLLGVQTCDLPGGVNSCRAYYTPGELVTLTATPGPSSAFDGWSGACAGAAPTCTVTMASAQAVTARFLGPVVLDLSVEGVALGQGTVRLDPPDLLGLDSCDNPTTHPNNCLFGYRPGEEVTLTATPYPGSLFLGWSGACSGTTPTCELTVSTDQSAVALFQGPETLLLAVQGVDLGTGSVSVAPADAMGLDACDNFVFDPNGCIFQYQPGQVVTLTATPGPESVFEGWIGSCAGTTPTCVVTMSELRDVTALFRGPQILDLGVFGVDGGRGSVSLAPADVFGESSCDNLAFDPNGCLFTYPAGELVTLTATPAPDSVFDGWSGACAGADPMCQVAMSQLQGVFAFFRGPQVLDLGVFGVDGGRGSVSLAPADVFGESSCDNLAFDPNGCLFTYPAGELVTLTATPAAGSVFEGWSGACTDTTPTCEVPMSTSQAVTAFFRGPQVLDLTVSGVDAGTGVVSLVPPDRTGLRTCDNLTTDPAICQLQYATGEQVTLTAAAEPGSAFAGWTGACTETAPTCDLTMSAAHSVTASFTRPLPLPYLTVRSTSGANRLEWVAPPTPGALQVHLVARSAHGRASCRFPRDVSDGVLLDVRPASAGMYDSFDHLPLPDDGASYCYGAFVELSGVFTTGRFATGRPLGAASGGIRWAFSTGAAAMAPPGIGPAAYVSSNDGVFYAVQRGASGGSWPAGFTPFLVGSPAQGGPAIVSTGVSGAADVALLGAQDGHVYAVDAGTGSLLWTSPRLGDAVQAPLGTMLTAHGGVADYVFAGSLDREAPNAFYALDASDGSVAASFDNGGGLAGVGAIAGGVAVVHGASPRVYFTSRARPDGSSDTLWCLAVAPGSLTLDWAVAAGGIDAAPVARDGRVYVGTDAGEMRAYDASTGSLIWTFSTGDGPLKGLVADDLSTRLYFATTNAVWSVSDDGGTVSKSWREVRIRRPSGVLLGPGGARLWVGGGDGRLYRLDLAGGGPRPTVSRVVLGDGGAAIGTPSYDAASDLIYVGSDEGVVYAVEESIQ